MLSIGTPALSTSALLSMSSGAGTPVHTCEQCERTFPFAAYLRQHVKEAHSEAGAVFPCGFCSKLFSSHTALENHGRLHQAPGGRWVSAGTWPCSARGSQLSGDQLSVRECVSVSVCVIRGVTSQGFC